MCTNQLSRQSIPRLPNTANRFARQPSTVTDRRSTTLSVACEASKEIMEINTTGTNRFIGASVSSITRHIAMSGAFCEAESRAQAPSSA